MTSTTSTRWWDSAVVCSRSIASIAMLTAVSKPNVKSVPDRSLSIVLGTPTTLTPRSASLVATPRVSSPPIAISASHAVGRKVVLDLLDAALDRERVGARRAEDRATARQDAADLRRCRACMVSFSSGPAPAVAEPDELMSVLGHSLADGSTDDCVESGAVASTGQHADAHRGFPLSSVVAIVHLDGLDLVPDLVGLGAVRRPWRPRAPRRDRASWSPVRRRRRTPGRQSHDLVHDLVGDRAQDVAVVLHALVATEVERLAETHTGPGELAEDLAGRGDDVGADDGDRDDRHAGLQRHPRHAGPAAVEHAVVRARALGIDAEELAVGESRSPVVIAPAAAEPLERSIGTWPAPEKKVFCSQPLMPERREVLGLGHERDPARDHERHEQPVGVREVVAGQDRRALLGDVLGALGPRPEDQLEQRAQCEELQEPIEHGQETTLNRAPFA